MPACELCERLKPDRAIDRIAEGLVVCGSCSWLSSKTNCTEWVRPMKERDLELVLAWRSNPEIYRHFKSQESPIKWKEHLQWYRNRSEDRHDYIIYFEDRRVGCVSLGADGLVSIYLGDFSARGEGVAKNALNWLIRSFRKDREIKAEVHEDNKSSLALFQSCGFERLGTNGEWHKYIYST